MKKRYIVLSALLSTLLLCSCGSASTENSKNTDTTANTVDPTDNATENTMDNADITTEDTNSTEAASAKPDNNIYVDFKDGDSLLFEPANGWSNGNMFNCTWRTQNCTFTDGKMQLTIDWDTAGASIPYSGAEYRSTDYYGYGRYEVSMKPIQNDGVVSSFFTYTGPTDNNPWDEIDIEFLGKDTTKVQFNYFTNVEGNHEYIHDLGFDASETFHTYAFEWHKDKIVWFVDGVEVYSATENIPVTEGKIMMNVWPGTGVDGWLNPFDDSNLPLTAEYEWISYTPFEE